MGAREVPSVLNLHCSVFLGSPACMLFAVGIQAAFSALLMGVDGCVLRIKLSAETSI